MLHVLLSFLLSCAYAGKNETITVENGNGTQSTYYALWLGLWPKGHKFEIYDGNKLEHTIFCQDPYCRFEEPLNAKSKKKVEISELELLSVKREWIRVLSTKKGCSIF
jgi:hypothetical protein